jgi:high affinity sulfate transporter 1
MNVDWRRLLPPLEWLPSYQPAWLKYDLVAGFTLAAYAIPVSMAYASLAGLAPQHGIYCYLIGGACYAVFGASRQLAVGPTSAISLLLGATIGGMIDGDPGRWLAIASLTALTVAGLSLLAWLIRLSELVNFISETILIGFKTGAALTIAMTQLPKLFGVKGGGSNFFERLWVMGGQLGQTNSAELALGVAALLLLLAGDKWLPQRPVALLVVALATLVVSVTSLSQGKVATVGALPAGLPAISLPSLRLSDVDGVLPLACACFLLSYIESISAARTLAAIHKSEVDARQELLAIGAANLGAAFGQGFPVAAGLSQSAVNDKAGSRTPLSLVFASATLSVCLLFLTGLLRNLPTVILAAIVLVAVRGLIDLRGLRRLWRVSRSEFTISIVALVGVLLFGILKGILIAAIASLVMLLTAAARPHVAFLGRIPGSRRYSDLARHPENELLPGILIFRVEAALLYFNVEHVRRLVLEKCRETAGLRLVICDLSDAPAIDVAGADMLAGLCGELDERAVRLRLVEAHAKSRDLLRSVGLEQQVGYLGRRMSIEQALEEASGDQTTDSPAADSPSLHEDRSR